MLGAASGAGLLSAAVEFGTPGCGCAPASEQAASVVANRVAWIDLAVGLSKLLRSSNKGSCPRDSTWPRTPSKSKMKEPS